MKLELLNSKTGDSRYLRITLPTPVNSEASIVQIPISQSSYNDVLNNIKTSNYLHVKHNGNDMFKLEKYETGKFDVLVIKNNENELLHR
jgi:hypothetical protein